MFIRKQHKYNIPIVSVVTQVDELDPKSVPDPPYDDDVKQNNISCSVHAMQNAFEDVGIHLLKTIPVSAYAEYDENNNVIYHNYWNVDRLVEYLINQLPKEAKIQFARMSRISSIQKKMARRLIASTATACSGIAITPIPIADIGPITALQISMIVGIGYISGRKMDKKTAAEFMSAAGMNVGAGFVLREVSRFVMKTFFPGAGNVVSSVIAGAATWGIGETAIAYFIEEKSMVEAKKRGKKAYMAHKENAS